MVAETTSASGVRAASALVSTQCGRRASVDHRLERETTASGLFYTVAARLPPSLLARRQPLACNMPNFRAHAKENFPVV